MYLALVAVGEVADLAAPDQAIDDVDLLAASSVAEGHLVAVVCHELVDRKGLGLLPLGLVQDQGEVLDDD
jgi:hypothetical protein